MFKRSFTRQKSDPLKDRGEVGIKQAVGLACAAHTYLAILTEN